MEVVLGIKLVHRNICFLHYFIQILIRCTESMAIDV